MSNWQVRASIDLATVPAEVLRKRRHAEHMSRVEREALADAILGMGKGQEARTFFDVVYRASRNPQAHSRGCWSGSLSCSTADPAGRFKMRVSHGAAGGKMQVGLQGCSRHTSRLDAVCSSLACKHAQGSMTNQHPLSRYSSLQNVLNAGQWFACQAGSRCTLMRDCDMSACQRAQVVADIVTSTRCASRERE